MEYCFWKRYMQSWGSLDNWGGAPDHDCINTNSGVGTVTWIIMHSNLLSAPTYKCGEREQCLIGVSLESHVSRLPAVLRIA